MGAATNSPEGLSIGFRDNLPPSVNFFDLDVPDAPNKIDRLALTMTSDDLAVLNVEARAPKPGSAYEWWMTASTFAGGKREEIRIPEQGTYRVGKVSADFQYWTDLVDPHVCAPDEIVQRGYPASEYWC